MNQSSLSLENCRLMLSGVRSVPIPLFLVITCGVALWVNENSDLTAVLERIEQAKAVREL